MHVYTALSFAIFSVIRQDQGIAITMVNDIPGRLSGWRLAHSFSFSDQYSSHPAQVRFKNHVWERNTSIFLRITVKSATNIASQRPNSGEHFNKSRRKMHKSAETRPGVLCLIARVQGIELSTIITWNFTLSPCLRSTFWQHYPWVQVHWVPSLWNPSPQYGNGIWWHLPNIHSLRLPNSKGIGE